MKFFYFLLGPTCYKISQPQCNFASKFTWCDYLFKYFIVVNDLKIKSFIIFHFKTMLQCNKTPNLSQNISFLLCKAYKVLCKAYKVGFDFVFPPKQSQQSQSQQSLTRILQLPHWCRSFFFIVILFKYKEGKTN